MSVLQNSCKLGPQLDRSRCSFKGFYKSRMSEATTFSELFNYLIILRETLESRKSSLSCSSKEAECFSRSCGGAWKKKLSSTLFRFELRVGRESFFISFGIDWQLRNLNWLPGYGQCCPCPWGALLVCFMRRRFAFTAETVVLIVNGNTGELQVPGPTTTPKSAPQKYRAVMGKIDAGMTSSRNSSAITKQKIITLEYGM